MRDIGYRAQKTWRWLLGGLPYAYHPHENGIREIAPGKQGSFYVSGCGFAPFGFVSYPTPPAPTHWLEMIPSEIGHDSRPNRDWESARRILTPEYLTQSEYAHQAAFPISTDRVGIMEQAEKAIDSPILRMACR